MSPAAYLCWLADHRWFWFPFARLKPAPEAPLKWLPTLLLALRPAILVFGMVVPAVWFAGGKGGAALPILAYLAIGVLGLAAGPVFAAFTALAWNQRATRLRTSGEAFSPSRPNAWVRWLLGPFYLFISGGVIPLVLFTTVENIHGAVVWRGVRTELLARGERLHLGDVFPAKVPDEQNFASLPLLADLLEYTPQSHPAGNTNAQARFKVFNLPRDTATRRQSTNPPATLAQMATAYRVVLTNQLAGNLARDGLLPLPAELAQADDATLVLQATALADAELAAVCEASQRPYSRFAVHWEEGFSALLPHIAHLRGINHFLDVRMTARLAAGDAAGALSDTRCSLRVAEALREEPFLVSQLVRFAQGNLAARTLARGLAAHAWNEAQLRELEAQLASVNYLAGIASGLEGERSGVITMLEQWITQRGRLRREAGVVGVEGYSPGLYFVSGWLRQNQARIAEFHQRMLETYRPLATNLPASGLKPLLDQGEQEMDGLLRQHHRGVATPYNVLARLLLPALSRSVQKAVLGQHVILCARTGCALERYRLAHGAYPGTLAALAPEFVPEIPRDLMDGQPLRYARTDDGRFRLWSVGLDGKDGGGEPAKSSSQGGVNEAHGDWVWPY